MIDDQELLFAWSGTPGTSFGAHIWNGGKAVLNQHIFKILFNSNLIDRVFLKHAINQTLDEQIGKAHGGVGLRHVTKGKFEDTALGLPPLPEQRRIVENADGLTARTARARKELNRVPTLIARYKQRLLALAFSGELTAGWRRANPDQEVNHGPSGRAVSLDDRERGVWESDALPDGWRWVTFDSAFKDVTDSKRKIQTKEYQDEGPFPVVDQGMAKIAGYTDREDMVQLADPPYVVFGDHTRCAK